MNKLKSFLAKKGIGKKKPSTEIIVLPSSSVTVVEEKVPKAFIFLQEFTYQTKSELVGIVNIIVSQGDRLEKILDIENCYSNGFTVLTLEDCKKGEFHGLLKAEY